MCVKHALALLALFLPLPAFAAMLSDCDGKEYDVIIRNSGAERMAHIGPFSGEIEEFGPVVSFQIKTKDPKDQQNERIMIATNPSEEFCIWSGKIKVQRLNTSMEGAPAGVMR